MRVSPVFSPSTCCGTVCRALDCVRATNPILNVQEHASGRIGVSSLPGHDLRHLATVSGEKTGLTRISHHPPVPSLRQNVGQRVGRGRGERAMRPGLLSVLEAEQNRSAANVTATVLH